MYSKEGDIVEDKTLISVGSQTEQSLTTGKSETRIFVKMYVDAVRTGLIAKMGAKNWTTLCVIASYMNANGECYPTQSQIALGLGVTRQTANKYIGDLLNFRLESGHAVIEAVKARDKGKFDNTRYTVNSFSNLQIF